jgi:uncharacterized protein YndB with AHSA1/START domain
VTKKNLEASIAIDAAPERVWSVLTDLARMPQWSPQCTSMRLLGKLREGAVTINWNRHGNKFWPTASKVERFEPNRAIAFRTLTNNSTWLFEIASTATGSTLTEYRLVPPAGTTWMSKTIVEHILGGEDDFDVKMAEGMKATLANIKSAVEHAHLQSRERI